MLHFSSVRYTYPHAAHPAVRDISFHLAPGEAMLCTGRSGCGKSTLIRLANGLAPHTLHGCLRGNVRAAGHNTLHITPAELAHSVGTLFQDPERQFFALTVQDELSLSLQWRGWEPGRVREALLESARLLGIEPLLAQTIFGLSEGQKQKVALAGLLAARPQLLVLDEPSANLDPESTEDLARTLAMLKARGVTLFVVDHRLSWMRGVADSVLVLDAGETVARGDFSLLEDAAIRRRYGLRAALVPDPRPLLPDARAWFPGAQTSPADTAKTLPPREGEARVADAPLFSCRNLSFAYPRGLPVFEKTNLSFAAGRIIALLGENGTGKTTLARLLTGLERPLEGEVRAGGKKIAPRELSVHAQVVLQNAGHQLRMNSVRAELEDALPAGTQPAARAVKVVSSLEQYGLSHLSGRHPQSLSGGEQQRLAVACATIRRPRMLILDEPTSGLDGENMQRMAVSIQQAASEGACLLVITHDLELMDRVCTEKIVLQRTQQEYHPHDNAVSTHR